MTISATFLLLDRSQGMAAVLFWASVPQGPRLRAESRDAHLKGAHTEGDSAGPVRAEAPDLDPSVLISWLLVF